MRIVTRAFLALDLVLAKFMIARPHVLVWPLLAVWTSILLTCRDDGRLPPLPLVLIVTLWTNLHGSFAVAWVVAAPIALDAVIASGMAKDPEDRPASAGTLVVEMLGALGRPAPASASR